MRARVHGSCFKNIRTPPLLTLNISPFPRGSIFHPVAQLFHTTVVLEPDAKLSVLVKRLGMRNYCKFWKICLDLRHLKGNRLTGTIYVIPFKCHHQFKSFSGSVK